MSDDWENVETVEQKPKDFGDEDKGESGNKQKPTMQQIAKPALKPEEAVNAIKNIANDTVKKLAQAIPKCKNKEEQMCDFIKSIAFNFTEPIEISKKLYELFESLQSKRDLEIRKKKPTKKPGLNSGKGTTNFNGYDDDNEEEEGEDDGDY